MKKNKAELEQKLEQLEKQKTAIEEKRQALWVELHDIEMALCDVRADLNEIWYNSERLKYF